jgi:hypothetical protein
MTLQKRRWYLTGPPLTPDRPKRATKDKLVRKVTPPPPRKGR